MIRPPARAGHAWVAYGGPSAPRVARSLDPLIVDDPARLLQQPGDLAIAVAAGLPEPDLSAAHTPT